jgi:environmental stress-induced protein Ves
MIHNVKLIKKEQQATNKWAGGTTIQLAIYPEDGSYVDRNFDWRLSSAVVELEESVFTKLPGFDRILMVLEGELKLVHEGHHAIDLKPFEKDSFKGEWNTVSYGRARDFNLMIKEGTRGSLEQYKVLQREKLSIDLSGDEGIRRHYAIYLYKGAVRVNIEGKDLGLQGGDLLLLQWQANESISVLGAEGSDSVIITACI